MELTQEQIKTGIKNQMQEFLSKLYIDFDKKQDYVMEPGTVNLFVADSVSFEIALKELLKVSQPASSEITTIKVSSVDGNSIPEMGKILKVIDEVNGWQEKGYSNVRIIYDEEATAKLREDIKNGAAQGDPYKIGVAVDDATPMTIVFKPEGGSPFFESDYSRKMGWMQKYVDQYASKPAVIAESFISRTLDSANKNRVFTDLAKKQAIYEAENGISYFMTKRDRFAYGEYCLQKVIGYDGSPFSDRRTIVSDEPGVKPTNNAFYTALGEVGPDGVKELILQEHLRWNVNYLAEGVVFGPKKDLEGAENGVKTSPWIVSAQELWDRSQKQEQIPSLDKMVLGKGYIAYDQDAKNVRDSMGYDLDGFAELCQNSQRLAERSPKIGDENGPSDFYDMEHDLQLAYLTGEEGLRREKELEASRKNQKISTPSL